MRKWKVLHRIYTQVALSIPIVGTSDLMSRGEGSGEGEGGGGEGEMRKGD